MFKMDLTPDPREQAAIEARRRRAEERKQRIFDTKQRTMGMDFEALEKQIEEKNARKQEEKELERLEDLERLRQAKVGLLLEKQAKEQEKFRRMEDEEFFKTQQLQRTQRLEEEEKASQDVVPGPSSLVQFDGEDLTYAERYRSQRKQQEEWALQQLHEQMQREKQEREREERFRQQESWQAQKSIELANQEAQARAHQEREAMLYNLRMAEEKKEKLKEMKLRESEENYRDMMETVNSDLISENRDAARSYGPRKVIPDRYKGMAEEEVAAIREEQLHQIEQSKIKKAMEAERAMEEQRQSVLMSRQALLQERALKKLHAEQLNLEREANARLAEDQKEKRRQENETFGKNAISGEFFDFFNRDAR
eukprot:m.6396 g.6396  ORF g.6396 m.6396 type:complete len:367 (-) comp2589_c0_seq1:212-1312(-)